MGNVIGKIKRWKLYIQTKHCLGFVRNYLLPSWNMQDVMIEGAIIIGCIMDIIFNQGDLIAKMIKLRSKQSGNSLPFPFPILLLCIKYQVLFFSNIDWRVILPT